MTPLKQDLSHFFAQTEALEKAYKKLQEKFRAEHGKLKTILVHISDGLLVISPQGLITHCNKSACDLLPGVEVGAFYSDLFTDELFGFSMKKALNEKNIERHVHVQMSDGRQVEIKASFSDEEGLILLLSDRTQLHALEASVAHNERLKEMGEMAATLAHEIRNPLGGIEGYASLLKRELPEKGEALDAIIEGTRTLGRLVTSVLEFSRQEEYVMAEISTLDLVRGSCALLGQHIDIEGDGEEVCVDRGHVELALLNLLQNAVQASSCVRVHLKGKTIVIEDEGPGIAPENLEKIFTPFFTTKTQGTGLGLARAKKVIEAHGGKLQIASTLGRGTKVRVEL